jgi:hypothetical protein
VKDKKEISSCERTGKVNKCLLFAIRESRKRRKSEGASGWLGGLFDTMVDIT